MRDYAGSPHFILMGERKIKCPNFRLSRVAYYARQNHPTRQHDDEFTRLGCCDCSGEDENCAEYDKYIPKYRK